MASYARSSQWIHKRVFEDEESLLIPLLGGSADLTSVVVLNDTGSFLWELLGSSEAMTESELFERLEQEFEFTPGNDKAKARAEVESYLASLVELGAVSKVF